MPEKSFKKRILDRKRKRTGNAVKTTLAVAGAVSAALVGLYLTRETQSEVSQDELLVTSETMRAYINRFGCNFPEIEISFDKVVDPGIRAFGSSTGVSVENAGPGWIIIDKEQMGMLDLQQSEILDIEEWVVAHAMSHACIPINPTIIESYQFDPQNDQAVGYHGLSINITQPDGSSTAFRLFEEAAANLIAVDILDENPYSSAGSYYDITQLIEPYLINSGTTTEDLYEQLSTNDVPGFVGSILNKQREEVSNTDIRSVAYFVNAVYGGFMSSEDASSAINGQVRK